MLQNSFRVPFRILKSRFQFHVSQPCTNWNMFSSVASSTYCCRPLTHHIQRHCRMLSSVIGAAPGTSPTKGIVYSMRPPVDIPEMSLASFMLSKFEKFKNLIAIVLPHWARVNLGAIAANVFSGFLKAPALLEPHHQIFLVLYPGHSLGGSYLSAVMQSMYFTAPAIWIANTVMKKSYQENGLTGETYTYDQVITKSLKTASALKKAGYKAGDTIAIFLPNCPEYLIIILAASALGISVSTVNSNYTSSELARQLLDSKSSAVFTNPDMVPSVKEALASSSEINVKDIIVVGNYQGCRPLSTLMEDDGSSFTEFASCNSIEDTMMLPYSSGTTGMPKGVMLTHHNIISNILQINIFPIEPQDRLVGVLPFYHIYGMVVVLFNSTINGSHIVTLPKFLPDGFLATLQNKKIQMAHLVPPIILFLAKHPMIDDYNLSSLKRILSGAAPLSKDLSIECTQRLEIDDIIQGYGLTETSPVVHLDLPPVKHSSVGTLVANTESKIINPENGQLLGPMESGELCVRGPQIMKGYLNRPEATSEILKDGWLHTGDIAHYDENGYFFITERLKELIKYKGFQVPPAELESVLLTHSDIQDCAVIGIPDEQAGELPRAYIVLKNNRNVLQDDIAKFLENKVAPHKKLRGGIEFVNEIPKSAAGKILRRVLKDSYLSGK